MGGHKWFHLFNLKASGGGIARLSKAKTPLNFLGRLNSGAGTEKRP
jgi:hypothetical protein